MKRAEALVDLDRAKSSFFASTSHEANSFTSRRWTPIADERFPSSEQLRTPLTLILGPLKDILKQRDSVSAEVRDQLEMMNRNANRSVPPPGARCAAEADSFAQALVDGQQGLDTLFLIYWEILFGLTRRALLSSFSTSALWKVGNCRSFSSRSSSCVPPYSRAGSNFITLLYTG